MMRAPSVMRCRSMPSIAITTKVMASVTGTDRATTMPVRQPSDTKDTNSTMTSASRKERSNSNSDSSTTLGWSAIWVASMPCGTPAMKPRVAASTPAPKSRMLAPRAITTPTPSAGLPSWRISWSGGSTVPRVTAAMSPRRKVRPPASTGVSATAATPSRAPVTRSCTRAPTVSTVPAGTTPAAWAAWESRAA